MKKTVVKTLITSKGYGIFLNTINPEELELLKKALTVKPVVLTDYDFGDDTSFPVYRLSDTRIYVPRFYGLKKYGPSEIKIKEGLDVTGLTFEGSMKEHQIDFCAKLLKELQTNNSCVACAFTGTGKCHAIDTLILMFDGSIKMVQDIQIGDCLMGDDSTSREVLSLGRGRDVMYEIIPVNGESHTFNSEHILCLKCTGLGITHAPSGRFVVRYFNNETIKILSKTFDTNQEAQDFLNQFDESSKNCEVSIKDYLKLSNSIKHVLKLYRTPVDFPNREVPFDPYIIGFWIGDGTSTCAGLCSQDSVVLHYLASNLPKYGCYLQYTGSQYDYRVNGCRIDKIGRCNSFLNALRQLNLIENKHIPDLYKINSRRVRLELLAGLIDSDGHLESSGCYEFTQKDETTMDGVIYLARSLGFSAYKAVKKTSWTAFRINISGDIDQIPCKISRKQARPRQQKKNVLVTGFTVVKKPRDDYYGFELNGNHKYVLGDFTVTHNTIIALWLASQLKKRTLIVVHKEFLLNQWVERIKQFLPNASIGVIQQNRCEVDNDIVIGMIQTLVKRDYPPGTFDSIGVCCIDEAHHFGCKGFSQLFFKIGTKTTLALSATPTRADGLTKVLEWFLGKIIKNEIVSEIEKPMIKFIEAEYSSTITPKFNFKGNLNAPNMVNQLVLDTARNKQILDEVVRLNKEGRRILVLSGRRGHCEYFDEQLRLQNLSSGLYLGGMKNQDLDASNQADIVIATFSMASEAYDNPALDTLVMATGMGAVTQSIGRILRRKNKFRPLVVDFTDIQYFGGQARRRKQYYKKSGYEIMTATYQDRLPEENIPEECMFEN